MADDTSYTRVPVKIHGTQEFTWALVDDEDYPRVSKRKWGMSPQQQYAYRKDVAYREHDGTSYYVMVTMHRFLMAAPDGKDVDHINGNRLDNRRANLRLCTRSENLCNRPALDVYMGNRPSSQYKGVTSCPQNKTNPWRANISVNNVATYLGCFPTEEDAARAYNAAAHEAHGEFARLNQVEDAA